MKNLELKAFYPDLQVASRIAISIGAHKEWQHTQTDTYFKVATGKLKMRQVAGHPAELIFYNRADSKDSKISDYDIFYTNEAVRLREILAKVLPIELTVVKNRTLFLWQNVRIHLDRVEELGNFIEFEAVLGSDESEEQAREKLEYLKEKFAIQPDSLIAHGYYELLYNKHNSV